MTHAGIFTAVAEEYPDCLRDESRLTGRADSIAFPRSEDEIREHVRWAREAGRALTVQGARTGITGGAVPRGGHILNLARMTGITGLRRRPSDGAFLLTVQPGVALSELRRAVALKAFDAAAWSAGSRAALAEFQHGAFFFPPDPTETSATIGGMVACNASGARTLALGATRDSVEALDVVLADGAVLRLRRGAARADGRAFTLRADTGRLIAGRLPSYTMPQVKNAAGYFVADDMDLLDLFIGSEGTLGIVAAVELRLAPAPGAVCGVMAFFDATDEAAVRFVQRVRGAPARPVAIEFFDRGALDLLRAEKLANPAFECVPAMRPEWRVAVYVEYFGADDAATDAAVAALSEILADSGGDAEATWLAGNEAEIERLKAFRHAVPEAVNRKIDERRKAQPELTKLGTDLAVPDASLEPMMALYREGLGGAGLEYVMFGHIGNNHVHVNIIPRTMDEYRAGKALYLQWARAVVRMGGTVAAEHGIGKLKTALLREMYGAEGIREMRALKALFDPEGMLNPGNLFGGEDNEP